jgi:Zn-dependent metalloprotease
MAAALDVIAHEWAHGMLESRGIRNEGYDGSQVAELHEGFGDVFGHATEKKFQPLGNGLEESSDWTIGEDLGSYGMYLRSASTDDGVQGHPTILGTTVNDKFHRDDEPADLNRHGRGNMLAATLKMMSDGGVNPICGRTGLGCASVAGIGLTEASNILFRTFAYYIMPGTMMWSQVANNAGQAAYDFYNTCTSPYPPRDPATSDQNAVATAFANIGYPRTQPFISCP